MKYQETISTDIQKALYNAQLTSFQQCKDIVVRTISVDEEKTGNKIAYPLTIFKNLTQLEIDKNFVNLINSIYKNSIPLL